jgi:hypothetical protein
MALLPLGFWQFGRHQIAARGFEFASQFRSSRLPDARRDLRLAIHEAVKIRSIQREQARAL